MANDCYNHLTITCDCEKQFNKLVKDEFTDIPNIHIIHKGAKGIQLVLLSAWKPNYKWLNSLISNYPDCWIKNEWNDDSGTAGIWIAYKDKDKDINYNNNNNKNKKIIKNIQWKDLSIVDKAYYFVNDKS